MFTIVILIRLYHNSVNRNKDTVITSILYSHRINDIVCNLFNVLIYCSIIQRIALKFGVGQN